MERRERWPETDLMMISPKMDSMTPIHMVPKAPPACPVEVALQLPCALSMPFIIVIVVAAVLLTQEHPHVLPHDAAEERA
jgi:hypothetical protein